MPPKGLRLSRRTLGNMSSNVLSNLFDKSETSLTMLISASQVIDRNVVPPFNLALQIQRQGEEAVDARSSNIKGRHTISTTY